MNSEDISHSLKESFDIVHTTDEVTSKKEKPVKKVLKKKSTKTGVVRTERENKKAGTLVTSYGEDSYDFPEETSGDLSKSGTKPGPSDKINEEEEFALPPAYGEVPSTD